jgi:hypothetical protein
MRSGPGGLKHSESGTQSPARVRRPRHGIPAAEGVPGNYYLFELFIEMRVNGITHLGYPKIAIRDAGVTPPVIRWGSPAKLAWPDPRFPHAPWIDDPENGLAKRWLTSPESLLGAEGMVGKRKYRFEEILQETKGQVVYSLFCEEDQTRAAYAFSREVFGAGKHLA